MDEEGSDVVTLGDYALLYDLGSGLTGKVKLAQSISRGDRYAVKIIKKALFERSPELEDRIHREIALMRLFDHPHLLKLIDVCESPAHLYIVLEYAEHGELFDLMVSTRQLPVDFSMKVFRQIIFGLEFLHMHAICHRDLKPENILMDQFDDVKIGDFGFARWMRENIAGTSCGSPHYAAPEIVRGITYDGRAADIWSCGVLLFALLAGHLPFNDPVIRNLFAKIKIGKYTMPDDVPAEIQDLINGMLTVDPVARLTITQIKEHPAFRIGLLSVSYRLPVVVPLPTVHAPLDITAVDPAIFSILKGIGFMGDDELVAEFTKAGTTMAKVFYTMLTTRTYDMFPWDDPAAVHSAQSSPGIAIYQRPQSPGVPRVASDQGTAVPLASDGQARGDIIQPCIGIHLPIDVLMAMMQAALSEMDFEWFHPDDFTLVARYTDTSSYVSITVRHETADSLEMDLYFTQTTQELRQMVLDHVTASLTAST
jgi:BR serine/threonine kinase